MRRFEELRDQCARRAWAIAYSLTRNGADADDVMQQAFTVAWQKQRSIPDDPWTWFGNVVVNCARNHRRKEARMRNNLDSVEFASAEAADRPAHIVAKRELYEQLAAAMADLTPDEQEAVALCHMSGLSHSEVSRALGIKLNTLKTRLKRGVDKLRARINPRGRGLEAYFGAMVIPPPAGGWEKALARWEGSAVAPAAAAGGYGIAKIALALLAPLLIVAGLYFAWTEFGSAGSSAAMSPVVAQDSRPNLNPESATSQPVATYDPPPAPLPRSAQPEAPAPGEVAEADQPAPRFSKVEPEGPVPAGTHRLRTIFYDTGEKEWEVTELVTGAVAVKDGPARRYYPSGKLWTSYTYVMGQLQGEFRTWYESGRPRSVEYAHNNEFEGWCTIYYESGPVLMEGNMIGGKEDGNWVTYHENGERKIVLPFRLGKVIGEEQEFDETARLIRRTTWDGKRNGPEILYHPDGSTTTHHYKDGELVE